MNQPVRVLFVCLGNICRSPMAEAVFADLVQREGLRGQIEADSAGTSGYHIGDPPHRGTSRILQQRGIAYTHQSRQVSLVDLEQFDYIVAMDRSNLEDLRALGEAAHAKTRLLSDYIPGARVRDVPDPYYSGNFEEVYGLVEDGAQGLLAEIRRDTGI